MEERHNWPAIFKGPNDLMNQLKQNYIRTVLEIVLVCHISCGKNNQ